ncbi:TcfC E-set like domain-containing protein [Herbaspirillum autotrophicum]|uniref:TcfC E-set like domain-containing protein n=1 Tax=Herbaspirillum autotrophicum TaxID=180195 RepID=UPI00067D81FC|nr:TcfC E-set like domain-containing protein [Herbaspirillum autotrophicum]
MSKLFPFFIAAALSVADTAHGQEQVPAKASSASLNLLTQAEGLPAEFRDHFFDVPLVVLIELDGELLGEARILVSRDETVHLIEFTDVSGSRISPARRKKWADVLQAGARLGDCTEKCGGELVALHYSLENSVLAVLTTAVERSDNEVRYRSLPPGGSYGAIVGNELNVLGGEGQTFTGRYAVDARGSFGYWNTAFGALVEKRAGREKRHSVQHLYAERELEGNFLRAGFFTPGGEGMLRQPRNPGGRAYTVLGAMLGSSDSLMADEDTASTYPLYVTASRQGMVEIFRNGSLINTQPVKAGLQVIDTRVLPRGIYNVEVRVIEDGIVTSRKEELIYKPSNWRNPEQRWRYNVVLGRQRTLLDNQSYGKEGKIFAGIGANYMLHPRVILGMSVQRLGTHQSLGSSVDWSLAERVNFYGNVYRAGKFGTGIDAQTILRFDSGSAVFSHSRAWLGNPDRSARASAVARYQGVTTNSSVALQRNFGGRTSADGRFNHSSGASHSVSLDLGVSHRHKLFNNDAQWRLSVFQRADSIDGVNRRNRGLDLTLNWSLGSGSDSISASMGARNAVDGGRDQYAALNYIRHHDEDALRVVSVGGLLDRYGLNLNAAAGFQNTYMRGDGYAQRSSFNGDTTAALNLTSTVAVGGGGVAASGEYLPGGTAGLIVDIESDVAELDLRADDTAGGSTLLRKGRNFVPVGAYKPGTVQFDLARDTDTAIAISPAASGYHLNKGGVAYRKITVTRTLTVLGRLVDTEGLPLKGLHVVNHAGRSVSEADGVFVLEMSARTPTIEVRNRDIVLCSLKVDPGSHRKEDDMLMLGDVRCHDANIAAVTLPGRAGLQ